VAEAAADRRSVQAGLPGGGDDPSEVFAPDCPGKVLMIGSAEFLARIKGLMGGDWGSETEPGRVRIPAGPARGVRRGAGPLRRAAGGPQPPGRRFGGEARAVAAYLARRWTDATLTELAADLGLSRAESVSNLRRRVARQLAGRSRLGKVLSEIARNLESRAKSDPRETIETKNKL